MKSYLAGTFFVASSGEKVLLSGIVTSANYGWRADGMRMKDVYSKKITSEEEQGGYVIVLKDKLPFFPALGRRFQMIQNGRSRRAMVESYPCSCRGPELPHSHFFVRVKALKSGDRVTVRKDSKTGSRYLLHVQTHPRRSV